MSRTSWFSSTQSEVVDLFFYFKGLGAPPPRWESCVSRTDAAVGFALSKLYVDEAFAGASKVKVRSPPPKGDPRSTYWF